MGNEKAIILQMVESGKISVDDAVKLIEAIKYDSAQQERQRFFDTFEFEDRLNRFSNSAENFAKDLSSKMNETWKGVEPKVKYAAKTAVEKTVCTIDKLSSALSESLKAFDENCESCVREEEDVPSGDEEYPQEDNEPKEN